MPEIIKYPFTLDFLNKTKLRSIGQKIFYCTYRRAHGGLLLPLTTFNVALGSQEIDPLSRSRKVLGIYIFHILGMK